GGTPGTSGAGGTGPGAGGSATGGSGETAGGSGCSCDAAGGGNGPSGTAALAAGLLVLALRRARHGRGTDRAPRRDPHVC
ncbi:MAG TPA: hypothetical protein VHM31_22580, partial [Polyangia bacterium]|nr:hypothetical protein [Polyangia bacterium]